MLLFSTLPRFENGVMMSDLIFGFEGCWWCLGAGYYREGAAIESVSLPSEISLIAGPDKNLIEEPKIFQDILVPFNLPQPMVVFADGTFATNYALAETAYGPMVDFMKNWESLLDAKDRYLLE